MEVPSPQALIERIRALPAAAPLLAHLVEQDGVYLVGGAVRDLLLGGTPIDLDLVVEGDAPALAAKLGPSRVHDRFGTAAVVLDGHSYDLASARRETYAYPGALPTVDPAGLDEDLRRRDFRVNAIAIELGGVGAGRLRSAPEALEDLEAHRLAVLHDASFHDDPTRLLRLARYASRLNFDVEPRTADLAREAIAAGSLGTVSGERVAAELRLLAREPDPAAALAELRRLGIATGLAPGFAGVDRQLIADALALLPPDGRPELVVLGLAFARVPDVERERLLDRLAFDAVERGVIDAAARAQEVSAALAGTRRPSDVAIAAAGAVPETVAIAGALGPREPARDWLERLRHVRLEIDGRDLLAAGVPQGAAVGKGLRAALHAKLDGQAAGREEELEHALRAARDSQ